MGVVDDVVKVRDAKGDVVGVVEELRLIPLNEHKGEKVVPPQQEDDTKAANSNPPADILPGVPTPTDDNFTVLPLPPRDPNETVVLPPPPVKDDNGECCCAFHYCVLECCGREEGCNCNASNNTALFWLLWSRAPSLCRAATQAERGAWERFVGCIVASPEQAHIDAPPPCWKGHVEMVATAP